MIEISQFHPKLENFKLGTKNALFGYSWTKIEKEMSYLKSAPSSLYLIRQ